MLFFPALASFALASEPALESDSDVVARRATFLLAHTAQYTEFQGFKSYYENVACPTFLHAAIGMTVEDTGHKTLYVIITVPSSRGGFTTLMMADGVDNNDPDNVYAILQGDTSAAVPAKAFSAVLKCYFATK